MSKSILLTASFDFHLVGITGIKTISSQACRNLFVLSSTCWHNWHIFWIVDHLFVTLVFKILIVKKLIIIILSTLTSMTILSNFGSTWLEAIIYNEGRFVNIKMSRSCGVIEIIAISLWELWIAAISCILVGMISNLLLLALVQGIGRSMQTLLDLVCKLRVFLVLCRANLLVAHSTWLFLDLFIFIQ
jgi:hypothetical protein